MTIWDDKAVIEEQRNATQQERSRIREEVCRMIDREREHRKDLPGRFDLRSAGSIEREWAFEQVLRIIDQTPESPVEGQGGS